MQKRNVRLMSLLLALVMLVSSVPLAAYAEVTDLVIINNEEMNLEQMANLTVSDSKIEAGKGLEIAADNLDIDVLKSIYLNALNFTDSTRLRVYWKTDTAAAYTAENSYVFEIELTPGDKKDDESYNKVYDLVLNGIDSFTGTLTGLRFEAEGATEGYIQIKELRLLPTLRQQMYYAGSVDSLKIQDDKKTVKLDGTLNSDLASKGGKIRLYELGIWENQVASGASAKMETDASENYSFSFELGSSLYSKFAVYYENGDEKELLDEFKFIENPEAVAYSVFEYPVAQTKKGLAIENHISLGVDLGIEHGVFGIQLNAVFSSTMDGIMYEFEGETYYMNTGYIALVDAIAKQMYENGMIATAGLIMYNHNITTGPVYEMTHPKSAHTGNCLGINTTNEEGVKYLKAAFTFLVERYSRADGEYGRVHNWILGNEVGSAYAWNDMGNINVDEFIRDYERGVRLLDTVVRSVNKNGRTFICGDALWDRALSTERMKDSMTYDNRVIIDTISSYSKASNDYNWNIAWHPYPQVLAQPKYWNDKSAVDAVDSDFVNFKNIEVLTDYLKMENNQYNGADRRVILTEQGFNCVSDTEAAEKTQAAAYTLAYYRVQFNDVIDSFMYYRPVDHQVEASMNFRTGLCKNVPGTVDYPGEKRMLFDIFKYIDTDKGYQLTEFALSYFSEELGREITDWSQLVNGFDKDKLAVRELRSAKAQAKASTSPIKKNLFSLDPNADYTYATVSQGWTGTEYVIGFGDKDGMLTVSLDESSGNENRGITYNFDRPVDLSSTPVINATFTVSDSIGKDTVRAKILVYSGMDRYERYVTVKTGEQVTVSANFSNWDKMDSVDRIKLWFIDENGEQLEAYTVSIKDITAYSVLSTAMLIGIGAGVLVAAGAAAGIILGVRKSRKNKKSKAAPEAQS